MTVAAAAVAAGSCDFVTGSHDPVLESLDHLLMAADVLACGGGAVAVAGTGDLGSSPKTGRRGYEVVRGDHDEGSTSGHSWR